MIPMLYVALIDDDDLSVYENLYNDSKILVYSIAMKILDNKILAKEVVSDTFLALVKSFQNVNNLNAHKKNKNIIITIGKYRKLF